MLFPKKWESTLFNEFNVIIKLLLLQGDYIMKSIIKEIFYGNRGNVEAIRMNDEYSKIADKIIDKYEELAKEMTDEQKVKFKEFCGLRDDMETETTDTHFIEGVKLGILLGIEACN